MDVQQVATVEPTTPPNFVPEPGPTPDEPGLMPGQLAALLDRAREDFARAETMLNQPERRDVTGRSVRETVIGLTAEATTTLGTAINDDVDVRIADHVRQAMAFATEGADLLRGIAPDAPHDIPEVAAARERMAEALAHVRMAMAIGAGEP